MDDDRDFFDEYETDDAFSSSDNDGFDSGTHPEDTVDDTPSEKTKKRKNREKKPKKPKKEKKKKSRKQDESDDYDDGDQPLTRRERKRREKEEKAYENKKKEAEKKYGEFAKYALQEDSKKNTGITISEILRRGPNFKAIRGTISKYGYNYSLPAFLLQLAAVIFGTILACLYFKLQWYTIALVSLVAILSAPVVIIAQYEHLYNSNKFDQLVQYLEYMIFTFKQHPKILDSLKETEKLTSGEISRCVHQAIEYIETNTDSTDVYRDALKIISDNYPSSRVLALHRAMVTVEEESSIDYQESIDNLYFDVREWTTRTYKYQTDLKVKKMNITISVLTSLVILALFTNIYKANPQLNKFTKQMPYQVTTAIAFILMIAVYVACNTKLNGQWLVDDVSGIGDLHALSAFIKLRDGEANPQLARKNATIFGVLMFAMFGLVAVVTSFMGGFGTLQKLLLIVGVACLALMPFFPKIDAKSKRKVVRKAIEKEFPIWLRGIALQLNNTVVVNAIRNSYEDCSIVMRPFIKELLDEINDDPTSIRPYANFMAVYNIPEVSISMKTLYSIQSVSKDDAERQISDLIVRNQEMLNHSEEIRNGDSLAAVGFLINVPMMIMAAKMMIDMILMMQSVLSSMSGVTG